MASNAYATSRLITPGTDTAPGTGICVACSTPGWVRLVMADSTFLDIYATQGTAIIDNLSVRGVSPDPAKTTATCTISVLQSF